MEVERHLFCILICLILNFRIFRRIEGIAAQTIIVEKGVKWFRCGLAKPKVQPILYKTIFSPFCMSIVVEEGVKWSIDVCATCWWEISNVCSSCLRNLPHSYCCTCFYLTKKNKKKQTRALPAKTLGSLNFIIIIITFIFVIYYYILFYFMCSPNFLSFSINEVKFAKINKALIYLLSRLLLLFIKVILKVH